MVDEDLKKLQPFMDGMLRDVVDVCERNHITYYIGCGTLLGAVRHQGFIPWDEDIDVLMPYEEYLRFLEVAQKELGDRYFVQNYETDRKWNRAYTAIRANNTTMMQESENRWEIHHGVWLDIFPLARMKTEKEVMRKKRLLRVGKYLLIEDQLRCKWQVYKEEFGLAKACAIRCVCFLINLIPYTLRKRLYRRILNTVLGRKEDYNYVAEVWCSITDFFPRKAFDGQPGRVLFNGREYDTVADADLYLRTCYGDYMTPVKQDKNQSGLIVDLENGYEKYMIR